MADEKILWCDVKDLSFRGPKGNEHVIVSILDPVITVEYHNEHYHIAARFNIETTILHYECHKRDGHELFFEDICLQYLSKDTEEKLKVHPQSDPAGSFSVTTTSTTSVTGQVGVTGSQTPSGNVMLGVTRSKQLAVQYNVNTWSVSAHRVIPDDKQKRPKLKPDRVILNGRPTAGSELPSSYYDDPNQDYYHLAYGDELAIHQWYWQGTQAATKTLSPDLKYTVKRHVFVKRIIPRADFPTDRVRSGKRLHEVLKQEIRPREMSSYRSGRLAAQRDREIIDIVEEEFRQVMFADSLALEQLLDFGFHLTVRVKKRFGRTRRTLMFSSNKVKADFLNPPYTQLFRIKVDPSLQILTNIPLSDTPNLEKILAGVKEEYDGNLDDLLGVSLDEVTDENLRVIKRGETPRPIRATRRHSIDQQQELRATRRAERVREHKERESRPVEIEIERFHPTSRERLPVFEEDERWFPGQRRVYSERVAQPERHIDLSPNVLRRGRSSPVIIV